MRTVSPVRGLRPVRASRATFWNVPNPVMPTLPPAATSRMITSRTASRASPADFLLPSLVSSALISSALFTSSPPEGAVGLGCPRWWHRVEDRLGLTLGPVAVRVHHRQHTVSLPRNRFGANEAGRDAAGEVPPRRSGHRSPAGGRPKSTHRRRNRLRHKAIGNVAGKRRCSCCCSAAASARVGEPEQPPSAGLPLGGRRTRFGVSQRRSASGTGCRPDEAAGPVAALRRRRAGTPGGCARTGPPVPRDGG